MSGIALLEDTADEIEMNFECGAIDVFCKAGESMAIGIGAALDWVASSMFGSQELTPGTKLWNTAIGEAGNWLGIAIIVMIASGIIGIATGVITLKPGTVGRSMLGLAAGIPSTYLALAVGGELLRIEDQMSKAALKRISGEDGFRGVVTFLLTNGIDGGNTGSALATGGQSLVVTAILVLCSSLRGCSSSRSRWPLGTSHSWC